ncbi:helix-turn-helix transcriptional regulator [Pedobacter polaris]|uniref:Helix-turn-helix transcriptional regulator n=1 Tax=Pedobacter polaris TaxID=2571273 RepID=A0A4V5NZC7_9SPHI|nr:helix-turn-helix transcriptional regulator [Pedobacter polaris]TKC08005.1 helix-turn-helix transcriptional regulator [Pedobacter polaris]
MTENQAIKFIRKQLGLDQERFAVALEMKQGSISDIERGKAAVSSKLKDKLSKVFYIDIDFIEGKSTSMLIESKTLDEIKYPSKDKEPSDSAEIDKLKLELLNKNEVISSKDKIIDINERYISALERENAELRQRLENQLGLKTKFKKPESFRPASKD